MSAILAIIFYIISSQWDLHSAACIITSRGAREGEGEGQAKSRDRGLGEKAKQGRTGEGLCRTGKPGGEENVTGWDGKQKEFERKRKRTESSSRREGRADKRTNEGGRQRVMH